MKIGIFDSGIGGLSVLHAAMHRYPGAEYIYYADREHVPYGSKSPEEVLSFVEEILYFLVAQGAEAVVIACNTATSVAVARMREKFTLPIIGMEPAVKKALDSYPSGRILAAATPITVQGEKMRRLLEKWDGEHRADLLALPELVRFAEQGEFTGDAVEAYLRESLRDFPLEQYCAFVLGCTHFNFFKDTLRGILPANVRLMDGVDGTVRHLAECVAIPQTPSEVSPVFYDSGRAVTQEQKAEFERYLRRLDEMETIE